MTEASLPPPIQCPACGATNDGDAVFCGNHACHKALGEFAYVMEELDHDDSAVEKLARQVARLSGHPHFITFHIAWFAAWIVLNSGMIAAFTVFDQYPYGLLGFILGAEGILITLFLLVSSARQAQYAEKRAELDYEVNVRTWRLVNRLSERLEALDAKVDGRADLLRASTTEESRSRNRHP